jgi:hypothetical protein
MVFDFLADVFLEFWRSMLAFVFGWLAAWSMERRRLRHERESFK